MIIRKISRDVLAREPYQAWNAFVNLLAMENYTDLDDVQRPAHLCFWYDTEVQNGGHLQYFENRGRELLNETLLALRILGAECPHKVLEAANRRFLIKPRSRIETAEEYVATALEGEFDTFDSAYDVCEPSIPDLLEGYLEKHKEYFVEIV